MYVEEGGAVKAGTVFPSVGAWIAHMEDEMMSRAPWIAGKYYRLSVGDVVVLWVGRMGHYREVRRPIGGRIWWTLDEFLSDSGILPTTYSLTG